MKQKQPSFLVCMAIALGVALLSGCANRSLSLWNDGAPAKTALVEYVRTVTKASSPDYIPPKERVAVFDLDGTLFLETAPTYFDWLLFEHRVLEDPGFKATDEQLSAARASRKGKFPKLDKDRERMVSETITRSANTETPQRPPRCARPVHATGGFPSRCGTTGRQSTEMTS